MDNQHAQQIGGSDRRQGEFGRGNSGENWGVDGGEALQPIGDLRQQGMQNVVPFFSSERPLTEAERAEMALRGQVGKVGLRVSNSNGGLFGGKLGNHMSAKDLTAEIDRATDLEMKAGIGQAVGQDRPNGMFGSGNVVDFTTYNKGKRSSVVENTTAAGGMSGDVVKNTTNVQDGGVNNIVDFGQYQRERLNNNFNNEQFRRAEQEIVHDQKEMAGEFAGEESKVETEEYLKADQEDREVEEGKGWEHKILTGGQKRLTREWRVKTEEAIKNDKPLKIEQYRNMGMYAMLEAYDRKFGRAS